MAELHETIAINAAGPKKVTGDTGSIEQHPLPEQIAADEYARRLASQRTKTGGVRYQKIVPPGAM